jgi:predicted nuclease with TOPRIM domain
MAGMRKALEDKKPGRKPKNYVKEDELQDNLEEIQENLKDLEKEKARLEAEKKKAVSELWMARRAISFIDKNFAVGAKKNAGTKKVLKEIFSNIPKKPYKDEAE